MVRLFLAAVCISLLILAIFADVEHAEHGHGHHHHDHDGHDHHDHESHKKMFGGEMKIGDADAQEDRLRIIAMKIDTDKNGKISRDEMRSYVEERVKQQQLNEANDFISTLDSSKAGKIPFQAYVRDNYGDLKVEELETMEKSDLRSRETRRNYLSDKAKWTHLDEDGDQYLTYEQFQQFLRPENYEELRKLEINSIIKEYDDNNDGKISNDEYLKMTEAESGTAESLTEELDTNKDGFGDYEEFARYYLPTLSSTAEEETDHLMKECDADKNGYCTSDEIIKAFASFASSQITDFGADLENQREEL